VQIKDLLKRLSEAGGVSGYEAAVRELVREEFTPYVDEMRTDSMGNLIALKRGQAADQSPRRSIMLAGHMDEIGLVVTKLEMGFIRFSTVGGFDLRVLPGQEVMVHGRRDLLGVIGMRPPHVLEQADRDKVVPLDELFVDVGLPENELREQVRVGDIITLHRQFAELANDLVCGKAFDNRAAVVCIASCLEHLSAMRHTWDVHAVATVQEEVGLKGALTSAFGIAPDIGIALDVTHGNMLGVSEVDSVNIGGGPAIGFGPNIHPLMFSRLLDTAKTYEMTYQTEPIPTHSGTDAWAIQITCAGIPTALLSVPLRYMHTTVETLSLTDLARTARLLATFIANLDETFAQQLGLEQPKT
jgi:putative aminopeptidase FrvX